MQLSVETYLGRTPQHGAQRGQTQNMKVEPASDPRWIESRLGIDILAFHCRLAPLFAEWASRGKIHKFHKSLQLGAM